MSTSRPLKKSETIEIRIPYPTKAAFMARCRQDGSSASEALRRLIDEHLAEAAEIRPAPQAPAGQRRLRHLAAGALIAAAVGAVALPTLARPACPAAAGVWSGVAAPQALRLAPARR